MGNSIFQKLLSTSLLMVVGVSIIIGVISYNTASRIMIRDTEKDQINELKQIDLSLLTIVEDVNQSAGILQNNPSLRRVFGGGLKRSFQRYLDALEVERLLKTAMSNNDAIQGFVILSKFQNFTTGSRIDDFTYEQFVQLPVYKEKIQGLQDDQYVLARADELLRSAGGQDRTNEWADKENRIFLLKKISSYEGNDVIILSFLSTASIMKNPSHGVVYAVDAADRLIWRGTPQSDESAVLLRSRVPEGQPEGTLREGNNRFVYLKSNIMDWLFINAVSEPKIVEPLSEIRLFVMFRVGIMIFICMIAAMIASGGLTRRIRQLKNTVHLKGKDEHSFMKGSYEQSKESPFFFIHSMKFGYKLFLYYLCIVIVPMLVLSLLLYQKTVQIVENRLEQSFRQPVAQAASRIDMLMNRHIRNVKYMITSDNVQKLFTTNPPANLNEFERQQRIVTNEIMGKTIYHIGLNNVKIYKKNGELLYSSSQIHDELDGMPMAKSGGNIMWLDTHADAFQNLVFSLVHEIKGNQLFTEGFQLPIGYLKVDLNESLLSQMFKDIGIIDKGAVWITNREDVILFSSDKQWIGKKSNEIVAVSMPEKMFAAVMDLSYSDWTMHAMIPAQELMSSKKDLITYNLFVLSILFFVIIIICIRRSALFVRPIHALIQVMKKVQEGHLHMRFRDRSGDEIELLGRSFNGMLDRLQQLIEEITQSKIREQELETKKRAAELNALQSQINPHFLYNTFESINWLVIQNENDKAVTMMTSLADLFRIGINRGENIVGLDEELQHAEAYITIQKIRYNDKLNVEWDIRVEPGRLKTMKLVLQPIIENAIYHGIELMEGPGSIRIRCLIESGELHLQIADNGLGMEEEPLTELLESFSNWFREPVRSIGLFNVNERIKLLFGDRYGLHITSKVNEGTIVTVTLPVMST